MCPKDGHSVAALESEHLALALKRRYCLSLMGCLFYNIMKKGSSAEIVSAHAPHEHARVLAQNYLQHPPHKLSSWTTVSAFILVFSIHALFYFYFFRF